MPEILIADDDPSVVSILEHLLQSEGYRTRVARTGREVLDALDAHEPDLILLDVRMPDLDGFETTRAIRENVRTALIPIIIVSGERDSDARIKGIQIGADDFVTKPFDAEELKARIARNLHRTAAERSANPLTGLPGSPRIEAEVSRRIRDGVDLAFIYIDADYFKAYNDVYGYAQGDKVIQRMADLLQGALRRHPEFEGFVGHVGGDDFAAVGAAKGVAGYCAEVCREFDALAPAFYKREHVEAGGIDTVDRRGVPTSYPLVRLTLGVATNKFKHLDHYAMAVEIASEMKAYGKSRPNRTGSAWYEDKRND